MINNKDLAMELNLNVFNEGSDKLVECGYCGDLLSWVMGKAESGCAWMTVMNNVNVAAVAVLRDVSCVVLVEGVKPDANLLARAEMEGIALYGTELDSYNLAIKINDIMKASC